jgi:hypothetical protein
MPKSGGLMLIRTFLRRRCGWCVAHSRVPFPCTPRQRSDAHSREKDFKKFKKILNDSRAAMVN